jgi:Polyketide cyclase / dehydrase and lipid transport
MPSNVFRFDESWDIPGASVAEVYAVLSDGELLPLWWKGVYLEAQRLGPPGPPKVGDRLRARARGALPYELNFILEATALEPDRRVEVKTIGDFEGLWSAEMSQRQDGVHVAIVWRVTVLRPILKFLAPVLRPAFAWNHRWTTPRGEKGLQEYLADQKTK